MFRLFTDTIDIQAHTLMGTISFLNLLLRGGVKVSNYLDGCPCSAKYVARAPSLNTESEAGILRALYGLVALHGDGLAGLL